MARTFATNAPVKEGCEIPVEIVVMPAVAADGTVQFTRAVRPLVRV